MELIAGKLPAVLRRRHRPPSTTFPSALTRIKSDALRRGHATPNGFTQKLVGSTGSYSKKTSAAFSHSPSQYKFRRLFRAIDMFVGKTTYPQSNMPSNTLIKPIFGKNTESKCQSTLLIFPLLVWVLELSWQLWDGLKLGSLSLFCAETDFEGGGGCLLALARWYACTRVSNIRGCGWRSHDCDGMRR